MENPIRKPSEREQKRLDRGRKMIREGSKASDDMLSKISTTYKQQARNDMKLGQEELDKVPDRARNYEAYNQMNYMKSGGSVSSVSKRADGCAQRGKTKGRFV
jgi:hypothetical protein